MARNSSCITLLLKGRVTYLGQPPVGVIKVPASWQCGVRAVAPLSLSGDVPSSLFVDSMLSTVCCKTYAVTKYIMVSNSNKPPHSFCLLQLATGTVSVRTESQVGFFDQCTGPFVYHRVCRMDILGIQKGIQCCYPAADSNIHL